jgi:hypothetical protein
LTGRDLLRDGQRLPGCSLLLVVNQPPGRVAAGDVRHRSIKRVASAVGERSGRPAGRLGQAFYANPQLTWVRIGERVGYLQARCDTGTSMPRIATELGVRDWQVQAALTRMAVRLAPRPQRLAAQRRRYTQERIAARVAALGFADVGAYLVDRWCSEGGCWPRWRRS